MTQRSEIPERLARATLVTGNPNKLAESRRILGLEIAGEAIDLPEIQSSDLETVLRAKADAAWAALGRPLVVEDTGLALAALNGFPGPLVKWLLEAVGAAGIARLGHKLGEPRAEAVCGLLYLDADGPILAEGRTPGTLVEPRGDGGFGWDPVFQPDGASETYAELSPEVKDEIGHRGRAWRALQSKLRALP